MKHRSIKQLFLKKCLLANMIAIASSYSFAGFVKVHEVQIPGNLKVIICKNNGHYDGGPLTELDFVLNDLGDKRATTMIGRAAMVADGGTMRNPELPCQADKAVTKNVLLQVFEPKVRNLPCEFRIKNDNRFSQLKFYVFSSQKNGFDESALNEWRQKSNKNPYTCPIEIHWNSSSDQENLPDGDAYISWNGDEEFKHCFASVVPIPKPEPGTEDVIIPDFFIKRHLQAADALPEYSQRNNDEKLFDHATIVFSLPGYQGQASAYDDQDPRMPFINRLIQESSHNYNCVSTVYLSIPNSDSEDVEFMSKLYQEVSYLTDKSTGDESSLNPSLSDPKYKTEQGQWEAVKEIAEFNARKILELSDENRAKHLTRVNANLNEQLVELNKSVKTAKLEEKKANEALKASQLEIEKLKAQLDSLRDQHTIDKREFERDLEKSQEERETFIISNHEKNKVMVKNYQETIEALKIQHRANLAKVQKEHDARARDCQDDFNTKTKAIESEFKKKELELKEQNEEISKKFEQLTTEVRQADYLMTIHKQQYDDSLGIVNALTEENEKLRRQLEKVPEEIKSKDDKIKELESNLEELNKKKRKVMKQVRKIKKMHSNFNKNGGFSSDEGTQSDSSHDPMLSDEEAEQSAEQQPIKSSKEQLGGASKEQLEA